MLRGIVWMEMAHSIRFGGGRLLPQPNCFMQGLYLGELKPSLTRPSTFQLHNSSASLATNYRVGLVPCSRPSHRHMIGTHTIPPNPFPLPLLAPLIPVTSLPGQTDSDTPLSPLDVSMSSHGLPLDPTLPDFDGGVKMVSCNNRAG